MFNLYSKRRSIQLFLPLLFICNFSSAALCEEPLVVFLVRHAEKVDNSQNPPLSAVGKARAKTLASVLQDSKIQTIHSTDYLRTKKTAAPIAAKLGLKTRLYNAGDLPNFVQNLKGQGGRHLVVGHSNTTPKLVELLGGDPGSFINDKEYDRLYILNLRKNGDTNTILIRFGEPSETATRN
ncbi:MAG: phosphoglycerate mutase family protein [Mariniblastus sp.]|nr:phosphoglycerate mutase family protein [Mariniblastus sp.]